MSPELIEAIRYRIAHGYEYERIRDEVLAAGHDEESFVAAYQAAAETSEDDSTMTPSSEDANATGAPWQLLSIGEAFAEGGSLAASRVGLLLKSILLIIGVGLGLIFFVSTLWGAANLLVPNSGGMLSLIIFPLLLVLTYLLVLVVAVLVMAGSQRVLLLGDRSGGLLASMRWALGWLWSFVVVAFVTSVIIQIGNVLFVIPGLIASFFFVFSIFVLIAEERPGVRAIIGSIELVSTRPFALALRYIVALLIPFGAAILIALTSTLDGSLAAVLSIVVAAGMLVYGWWFLCYLVVLYKNMAADPARKHFSEGTTRILKWVLITVPLLAFIVFASLVVSVLQQPTQLPGVFDSEIGY